MSGVFNATRICSRRDKAVTDFLRGRKFVGQPTCVPSADAVAAVIGSHGSIDTAAEALRTAGWHNTVAGGRINIGDRVFARFVNGNGRGGSWVIYGIGDQPPVRVVATGSRADVWNEVR